MHEDWELSAQHVDSLVRAGDTNAAIRAVDDADWDLDDELNFNEPFDPYADDPE
jgi:hypothetical protein